MMGSWSSWVAIMANLKWVYDFLGWNASNDQWLATFHGFFPPRAHVISTNPGRGHGGLLSDVDCNSIISLGGVVGASILVVACSAVAVDWLSLWATNREPLGCTQLLQLWPGWASHGTHSVSQGKVISIQLDGTAAAKTSTSLNKTSGSITHHSSITLLARQWGWPGIGSWIFSAQCCNALT